MTRFDDFYRRATATQLHAVSAQACLPSEIASRAVGLHAARIKTPHMTLVGRRACAGEYASLTPPTECPLVKAPLMRSTLHYVLESEFAKFHCATVGYRVARRLRSLRRLGLDDRSINALRLSLIDHLSEEGIPEDELLRLAQELLKTVHVVRGDRSEAYVSWQICRLLWDNGDIRMTNIAYDWRREQRHFRPWPIPQVDTLDAVSHLVLRYITAYGPVSAKDVAWWSALGARTLKTCLDELSVTDRVVQIHSGNKTWYANPACSGEHLEASCQDPMIFLAYEDPFIKAYFDTRDRYASPYALSRLFHSTGEARASVLLRGRVRGIWEVSPRDESARLTLCPSLNHVERQRAVDAWEEHLLALCGSKPRYEVIHDTHSYQ